MFFVTTGVHVYFFAYDKREAPIILRLPDGTEHKNLRLAICGKSNPFTFLGSSCRRQAAAGSKRNDASCDAPTSRRPTSSFVPPPKQLDAETTRRRVAGSSCFL